MHDARCKSNLYSVSGIGEGGKPKIDIVIPYTDKKIWCVCMHMKKPRLDEGIRSACMDLDGNIVDISKLREQDQKAYREKYGKLHPLLYDRLQSMQSETKIILEDAEHSEICNVTVSVPELEVEESYTDTVGPFTMP